MATTGIYKLDDGNCHPTNCFPARSLLRPHYEEGTGHWEVARQAAEQTKIEWLFGPKSTRIKWKGPGMLCGPYGHLNEKTLTGTLLMKLHHVKSPSHLCSVDISNRNFVSAKEEEFEPFDSVAYINATENLLTLEVFRTFPALRELDLSLNGLRNLKVDAGDFPHLQVLDLSYNNLSPKDILALGVLPHLKVLHLTANGLRSLPPHLAGPDRNGIGCPRFPALEVLFLDDNHLSHPDVFVSLASLRGLKELNLDRNGIKEVPYLQHLENSRFSIHPLSAKSGIREGLRTRKSSEIQQKQDPFSGLGEQADSVVMQNTTDPDKRGVLCLSCSLDTSVQGGVPSSHSKISSSSFDQEFVLPLMELRYLSLANNQIEQEEDLLAVALFPSLRQLTFYGNPFTTSQSGDPPLLTIFLQDKMGIKLVRKKISKLEKPRIFIPVKANREVKSALPRLRKHPPMLEAPLETTFWQLWSGTEPGLKTGASLDESEPLPPIGQFSAEKWSSATHPPFQEESGSEFYSAATLASQEDMPGLVSRAETSFNHLCGPAHEVPSMLDQILLASLPPRRSFLGERSPSGLATPAVSPSSEQDLSRSLLPTRERAQSEKDSPVGMPSTEQELPEPVALSSLSEQEANPFECFLPSGLPTAEEDPSQVLQPVNSAVGQPAPSPDSPSEPQALSEPAPPIGSPTREQDLAESLPRIGSTLVQQDLLETSPPTGSPGQLEPMDSVRYRDQGLNLSENALPGRSPERNLSGFGLPTGPPVEQQDLLDVPTHTSFSQQQSLSETVSGGLSGDVPPDNSLLSELVQIESSPCKLLPEAPDLLEPTSLPRSSSEDQDLSWTHRLVTTPSATQDPLEFAPLASSSFQDQVLPEPVPPTISPTREQDMTEPLLPPDEQISLESSPPLKQQDQMGSLPPVVRTSQELLVQSSSIRKGPPSSVRETNLLSSSRALAGGVSGAKLVPEKGAASKQSSHAWSSFGDLHLLFERDLSSSLTAEQLDKRSSSDYLMAEQMESFFMTQVAEASEAPETLEKEEAPHEEASAELKRKRQPVPRRYRGYEELLDGSTDPDFIEPRGIHQNVKALEWALRHPLVYREPRARLDSLQKPYVPREKKVLRVPAPSVQKTKAQILEELLQQMEAPTNIIEVPLVCVLRKKKSNWHEYREALALLKDFRKNYKASVTTTGEARSVQKRQSQTQLPRSLTGIKVSGPCMIVTPPSASEDDKGL